LGGQHRIQGSEGEYSNANGGHAHEHTAPSAREGNIKIFLDGFAL
jgi:hypothetical protein